MNEQEELIKISKDIWNAYRTANNGAYPGEAVLCPAFAERLKSALRANHALSVTEEVNYREVQL